MQTYTKILIGMVLGIALGLVLGGQSPLLEKDLIVVSDPSQLHLLKSLQHKDPLIQLPAFSALKDHYRLDLTILDRQVKDEEEFYRVVFEVDDRLALKDRHGKLKSGQRIDAWISASEAPLPVNRFGEMLIAFISPLGIIFLRLISMVVIPLVFASLLMGVVSLGEPRHLGILGGKTFGYFLLTTSIAITIGLVAVNIIQPGKHVDQTAKARLVKSYQKIANEKTAAAANMTSAVDNLLTIIPKNPVKAFSNGNMLQIIFFALIFGIALIYLGQRFSHPVVSFFDVVNQAMMKIVDWIMRFAPIGVFALVAEVVGQTGLSVLYALLIYCLTVVGALLVHSFVVYTPVAWSFGKVRPGTFWRAIRPAQLIAFSTSSSSAALPVTMDCAEQKLGISGRISAFVLPLGSTVNMDGTALYQGVAAVFIAQLFNIELSFIDQASIVLSATLASIGAAGVPGVGMITLTLVLTAIRIPTEGIALILGVDRILDMFRTAVNITGDLSAALLVASTEGELNPVISQSEQDDALQSDVDSDPEEP